MSKINSSKSMTLNKTNDAEKAKEKFIKRIVHKNSMATNHIRDKDFDINKSKQDSNDALLALGAHEGLQSMLVAQMLSIHDLQQRTATYAISAEGLETKNSYINLIVKLTNCFTQQANMLARLQGAGGQKIIVEHVEVHQGGQAVVGNIQGGMGNKEKT